MLELVRKALQNIIDDIDAGNTHISEDECIELLEHINLVANVQNKLSVYQACKFLGISRATFDNYVKSGKIPPGRKQQGFKEKFYLKEDLIKIKESLDNE